MLPIFTLICPVRKQRRELYDLQTNTKQLIASDTYTPFKG